MTDVPDPQPPRPDIERDGEPEGAPDLPPGGLPDGPQGDEVDPGTG
jgi:hypothetical protein